MALHISGVYFGHWGYVEKKNSGLMKSTQGIPCHSKEYVMLLFSFISWNEEKSKVLYVYGTTYCVNTVNVQLLIHLNPVNI